MKNSLRVIIMICCTGLLLSSCSKLSNISVTKRHYRSGYSVDFGSSTQHRTKPKVSEAMTTAATLPAADKLKDKSDVPREKITPALSPVFISGNPQEKNQAHKNVTDNFYASTRSIANLKREIQPVNENSITSLPLSSSESTPQWLLIVFSILLPPLAIALKFGIETKFWISILLTLLFWIPGVIYALYWILQ